MNHVSVVIPHYGNDTLLDETLTSLEANTPDYELVVWDGNQENHGFAGNCNRAAEEATGDVLVFLNNDCQVLPGWLPPILTELDTAPVVGAVLMYPNGEVQHGGVDVTRYPDGHLLAVNRRYVQVRRPVDAVTGALLAITADTFAQVGGFDEGYWNGYEDVDLCLTARLVTGRRPAVAYQSKAIHHESRSGPERWTRVRENEHRLNDKWGDRWL